MQACSVVHNAASRGHVYRPLSHSVAGREGSSQGQTGRRPAHSGRALLAPLRHHQRHGHHLHLRLSAPVHAFVLPHLASPRQPTDVVFLRVGVDFCDIRVLRVRIVRDTLPRDPAVGEPGSVLGAGGHVLHAVQGEEEPGKVGDGC